jgi:hypothetical protein
MFADWPIDLALETTVTFEAMPGDRTRLTVRRVVMPPDVGRTSTIARLRDLARQGWIETLERLAGRLAGVR